MAIAAGRCLVSGSTPEKSQKVSLSVFFPAFNDAASLPGLIQKTFAVLEEYAGDYEVIVVNDGSRDDTAQVLDALQVRWGPRLSVVTHAQNRGYGAALRSGFDAARGEYVFYTDGDAQYDVAELPKLLDELASDVGMVNGYKLQRSDPWHRIAIGHVYNRLARFLFRIRIRDVDCDFRLIRRGVLRSIRLESTSGTVCVELVRKIELSPFRVVEVGVHHYPRQYGRSQFFRVRSLFSTFWQLTRLYVHVVLMPRLRYERWFHA